MQNINETVDLLEFVLGLSEAIDKSLSDDGKITRNEFASFLTPFMLYGPKAVVGIQDVPKEWKDLSQEEAAFLITYFEGRFDLTNEKLELLLEKTLRIAIDIVNLVKGFKSL